MRIETITMNKKDFTKGWPFKSDTVQLINKNKFFLTVKIEGVEYALNGIALNGGYKDPFKAGVIIKNKSLTSYIDKALKL